MVDLDDLGDVYTKIDWGNGHIENAVKRDSGAGADRIIMLATDATLEFLRSATHMHLDDTFQLSPECAYQIYVVSWSVCPQTTCAHNDSVAICVRLPEVNLP